MHIGEKVTILGLGNLLCGDDAFGIQTVERLYANYDFPPFVQLIDGGTLGHMLLSLVRESKRMLVFDAMDACEEAGKVAVIEHEHIPVWLGMRKISPHQNSFSEILALSALKDELPGELVLVTMQPVTTNFGESMSPVCKKNIPAAIRAGLDILQRWEICPRIAAREKHLLNNEMLHLL